MKKKEDKLKVIVSIMEDLFNNPDVYTEDILSKKYGSKFNDFNIYTNSRKLVTLSREESNPNGGTNIYLMLSPEGYNEYITLREIYSKRKFEIAQLSINYWVFAGTAFSIGLGLYNLFRNTLLNDSNLLIKYDAAMSVIFIGFVIIFIFLSKEHIRLIKE